MFLLSYQSDQTIMPTPGEHKTVQTRILANANEVGWSLTIDTDSKA